MDCSGLDLICLNVADDCTFKELPQGRSPMAPMNKKGKKKVVTAVQSCPKKCHWRSATPWAACLKNSSLLMSHEQTGRLGLFSLMV